MSKPEVEVVTVAQLTPDDRNANRHTPNGMQSLADALQRHKFGRPTLADKNLRMIAGNGVLESVASVAGVDAEVIVVRTRGDKMIVHVREDLDLDDPETRRMALEDNRIQEQNLDWDPAVLHAFDEEGIDMQGLWSDDQLDILRAAKFKPTDEAPLPEPAAKKEDEEREITFSPEQWKTVQAAIAKLAARDEHAGLDLMPADALVILCGEYLEEPPS